MEFRETLLAAQRNQQQKSSESSYYKARFDPPKKEQKQRDRLSANIQKFLAKKDEEEKQKKLEAQRKRDELLAMRDPKALRKIQKTLKVIKSANKSVLEDAVDRDNTAVTLTGPEQPDQDDYGYESQEAAAIYAKMMQKYSKIPDEPKFPTSNQSVKRDLKGTMERVKHALQHEDDPVPHKRRRRTENGADKEDSPPRAEPAKEVPSKPDKPKVRKPMPPPMDFNQLLKLAEQKKLEPVLPQVVKKQATEAEPERPMTKKQRRDYEEEMARRQRRQERLDADKAPRRPQKEEKPAERERIEKPSSFGRIPKLNDKNSERNNSPRPADRERDRERRELDRERTERDRERTERDRERTDKDRGDRDKTDKMQRDKDRMRQERERLEREKERVDREKDRIDRERLERLKAERERIDRELERLSKDKERLEKSEKKVKMENGRTDKTADRVKPNSGEVKKTIDLKNQNTYRIDKNSNERRVEKGEERYMNGHGSQGKVAGKTGRELPPKNELKDRPVPSSAGKTQRPDNGKRPPDAKPAVKRADDRPPLGKQPANKPKISNSFDFDSHVKNLKKDSGKDARHGDPKKRPDDARRKQNRRVVDSESEYDSEMDDFIDDGDENMDYSRHIKEIFGYDKSKYRDMDDDDDPTMESSFARQQREEFISKKIGIMEDLEDMRMEAEEKKKSKKKRRISDD